ncbi:hypothetical protein, partial [Streptomyces sp. NBRC 110611]|uniref:hypothetical protein n=1 Tax=Streptomyces sp. NBRC 110611 TaxID=1621259 RepID=UPI001C676177
MLHRTYSSAYDSLNSTVHRIIPALAAFSPAALGPRAADHKLRAAGGGRRAAGGGRRAAGGGRRAAGG